ncbi:MAG: putative DNA modification/repair radical SAM protein [archaeon]|nr:putative DNA modification/repair radical SAM protein [archaeon]
MNTLDKLKVLGGGTKWDICTPAKTTRKPTEGCRVGAPYEAGVCRSFTPDGRCVSLLKVLNTNSCVHDCKYCIHSTSSKKKTITMFEPKELADLTMQMYLRNYIEGLFLSSGVLGNSETANQKIIDTMEILRNKHKFQGYVHLKIMPGSDKEQIKQLIELSDRVSLNLESPTKSAFGELCSTKDYNNDVLRRLRWINDLKQGDEISSGFTTQMVVGAAGETDMNYLETTWNLYKEHGLRRAYFSAFDACAHTPLENGKSIPLRRENFLYRMDWMLRFYKFKFSELKSMVGENGNMPLNIDPKMNFALQNPDKFPVDINNASFDELIRVPGIGLEGAKKIEAFTERNKIHSINELKEFGIRYKEAALFIEVEGLRQTNLRGF